MRKIWRKIWRRTLGWAIFLLLWQAVCSAGLVSPIILASPLAIARAFLASGWEFLGAFRFTLGEIVAGIALAWTLGIGIGALLGLNRTVAEAVAPLLSSLFAVPLIVWYPMLMVWLGIGPESKVVYGVIAGFFPIALNTLTAVQHLDRRFLVLARSLGAGTGQLMLKFVLPLVLPSIVSGLRIGTAFVVIGILVSEMLASTAGLGFWISYNRTLFNTGHVYLGIVLALACTLIVNAGLGRIERRVGRWRDLEKGET